MVKKKTEKQFCAKKCKDFIKTPLYRTYILTLITLFIFWYIWGMANIRSISLVLIFIAILTTEFVMIVVESILHYKKMLIFLKKHFRGKKNPKLFELVFFLSLFIGAFSYSFAAAGHYVAGKGEEVFANMWWFAIFYGIALACGYYHYILRIDDQEK